MTSTPVEQLAEVLGVTERLIAAVHDEQWADPTPCTEWNVRDLAGHLIAGNLMFAAILRGEAVSPADAPKPRAIDALGGDELVAAYRDAAGAVLAAFGQPGVLEKVLTIPFGTVPGVVAAHLRITEVLVHGWDLARATHQAVQFPDDIVEQELRFTRGKLPEVSSARRPFAPPQPVPDDAPAIDRLAACLGRPVTAAAG